MQKHAPLEAMCEMAVHHKFLDCFYVPHRTASYSFHRGKVSCIMEFPSGFACLPAGRGDLPVGRKSQSAVKPASLVQGELDMIWCNSKADRIVGMKEGKAYLGQLAD